MNWVIKMWESKTGRKPVFDWLSELEKVDQKKVAKLMGLIEQFGPMLPLPHNRNLGSGLYELRDTSTGPGYRIYYFVHNKVVIVLLAAGDKSSQERDIETARKRMMTTDE